MFLMKVASEFELLRILFIYLLGEKHSCSPMNEYEKYWCSM